MRAAVFDTFGGPVAIADVPDPTPPAGGIVLEVRANGVCRSDWHAWIGHDPSVDLPHVPGHEMAGVVAAVGSDVTSVRVGDRVTVPFVLGCGRCEMCISGNQQVCSDQYQAGFDGWGGFAEYVALPYADVNVVRLPDEMTFETAAGLGCRFATAFRAVLDQGAVQEGAKVAIWGCGGVGLSAVMIASSVGAEVHAIDINDDALALASDFGADYTYNSLVVDDPVRAIKSVTGGGVTVSIDALGATDTAVSSIKALRPRGRHVQVGLMIGDDARPVIPMWRLHAMEIELYGSHGMQAWQYPEMLTMVGDGTLAPDRLVTSTVNLEAGAEHLTRMADFPGTGFVVINDFGDSRD